MAPWVREQSHRFTGVLDYHRQFRQPAHEKVMVDEPWDALKGEVGPVLASSAPSTGHKRGPARCLAVAPRSILLLLLKPGGDGKRRSCQGLGSVGYVSGEGRMGQNCLRDEVLVLGRHGSRPNKRPARAASQRGRVFLGLRVLGCREAVPFREATTPRKGQYHSRLQLHLQVHLHLHLHLHLHHRVFPGRLPCIHLLPIWAVTQRGWIGRYPRKAGARQGREGRAGQGNGQWASTWFA